MQRDEVRGDDPSPARLAGTWRRRLGLAALVLLPACGNGAGPSEGLPAALVGNWVAEPGCLAAGCGLTVWPAASPADSVQLTALGVSTEVDIATNGRFRIYLPPPTVIIDGRVRVEGNELVVTDDLGNVERLPYTVTPTRLTLQFTGELDFNADGTAEAAVARGVFARR